MLLVWLVVIFGISFLFYLLYTLIFLFIYLGWKANFNIPLIIGILFQD
jgi:hypothetical protein